MCAPSAYAPHNPVQTQRLGINIAEQRPPACQYDGLRRGSEGQGWAYHVTALYIHRSKHRYQRRRGVVEAYGRDADVLGQLRLELKDVLTPVCDVSCPKAFVEIGVEFLKARMRWLDDR